MTCPDYLRIRSHKSITIIVLFNESQEAHILVRSNNVKGEI